MISIKVGSRKSQLALIQTESVVKDLTDLKNGELTFEIVTMTTTGDQILDKALSQIGEKSLFTKELEVALTKREVSFVVHSLKDLPTVLPPGMVIGAVCKRCDPSDAVVFSRDCTFTSLKSLPNGSVVGTSSLRRVAQLKCVYPHLDFQTIRGNLNTRLKKLDEGGTYSALILATAGLKRIGWEHRISCTLSNTECMYAVGQGALAVECLQDDTRVLQMLSLLSDTDTLLGCVAERAFMKTLSGGCTVPIGVWTDISGNCMQLTGGVFSLEGSRSVVKSVSVVLADRGVLAKPNWPSLKSYCGIVAPFVSDSVLSAVEHLGIGLANDLLKNGAADILKEIIDNK